MPQKKTINLAVPVALLEEFNEVCRHYGHAKQKGLVLSAAMLMFLEADPAEQGKALERILIADVRSGVETLIDRARAMQAERVRAREAGRTDPAEPGTEPAGDVDPGRPGEATDPAADASPPAPSLRRAAKAAGDAKKPLKDVPRPPESAGD